MLQQVVHTASTEIQSVKLYSATCGAESDGPRSACRIALDAPDGQLHARQILNIIQNEKSWV